MAAPVAAALLALRSSRSGLSASDVAARRLSSAVGLRREGFLRQSRTLCWATSAALQSSSPKTAGANSSSSRPGRSVVPRVCSAWGPSQTRGFAIREVLVNEDIPFPKVRVVDNNGLVGDYRTAEALALARQRRTDLVVLSGVVEPPLCRLVDLDAYLEELDRKEKEAQSRKQARSHSEFSFDPAMKVKGIRFMSTIDEHDFERKVNQLRAFLEKGHRVEARILQGRSTPEDTLDLALRICGELRDLAKPEDLDLSVKEFRDMLHMPKSKKNNLKDVRRNEMIRLRLWPCSPEQAASFQLPANIVGPRRRRGPAIVGIGDEEDMEQAWKMNRKPGARLPVYDQAANLKKYDDNPPE
eukprot:TRINITY_DN45357_c0_g1_i1.p1 TRINITY_DN45357_c0_g1~~TRINITY_DN45357_c0_g1_i1.p1  ORF type:complete len:356 (-),score=73.54 TRINITY_DN45357_c0_g1_i1:324-1391(-)